MNAERWIRSWKFKRIQRLLYISYVIIIGLALALLVVISGAPTAAGGSAEQVKNDCTAREGFAAQAREKTYCYALNATQRDLVECVCMAEAEGEGTTGQMAVAQCILDACQYEDKQPAEIVELYRYSCARPDPSESVISAVSAVFDAGERVTEERTLYFYAPARVESGWHEGLHFVCEIGGHRFFNLDGRE